MANKKVSCQPPKGKKGYTMNFRHPVVKDKDGKYGLKVHRGLGTNKEEEAKRIAADLEQLMEKESWWDLSKKEEAYHYFNAIAVDAFYDPMESVNPDETKLLDKIYLPGRENGYTRSTIIGPSGAGKTTLVRLLAGTAKEKFPTTSTGRTTTCSLELIMAEEKEYEIVVTFLSRHVVEMYVQECIEAAFDYIRDNSDHYEKAIISDKLFIHRDLVVRLSYILGDLTLTPPDENVLGDDFDEFDETEEEKEEMLKQDNGEILETVNYFIDEVIRIACERENKETSQDSGDDNLEDDAEVLSLRDEMINEIMARFSLLKKGEQLNSKGKWVNGWYFRTTEREEFFQEIKKFTSNAKRFWGSLLTPIVKKMRVKGNFSPSFQEETPKIVLFDGLGLGHRTTATSMPNHIVEYFKLSDSIIIVDNAQAPILDNSKLALKTVIEYGYADKVVFAFTHVDLMKGDNFLGFSDRKRHVLAALNSYLFEMRKQNRDVFSDMEAESILKSCYFFSELDKPEANKMTKKFSIDLLHRLKDLYSAGITINDVTIQYDAMTLYMHLQTAIQKYRENWSQIMGYPSKAQRTEHWSKIKALTRRLAYFGIDHYNYELMPLADFSQEVRSQLNLYLNKPLSIMPKETSEEIRVTLINELKSHINAIMGEFINRKMWKESQQLKMWREAYGFRGRDSTYYRAAKVNEILEMAAPRLESFAYYMTEIQKNYVMEIIHMVEKTLNEYGCTLEKFNY